ncbi:hypothetical protein [Psychrobacter urativorans]|uniref:Uncharacterized protein n=1 Tax=Psychrobacter urativorans TaxID=45610 RepID=A0A0M3V8R0_9GAMM|nr:hypothetical protein [Psychrobacter urativorans]ALF59337.1 hypothetical protein AOC03_04125 [Psychrobacter urativorans]
MDKKLAQPSTNQEPRLFKLVAKIILRIINVGLAVAIGFWLFLASTMGPSYLPNMCTGCLDFWIRMTMVGVGAAIWMATAFWLIWLAWLTFRYIWRIVQRSRKG